MTLHIYLFYLIFSVPFFFAGAWMALISLAMSGKISKFYFADLIGAASFDADYAQKISAHMRSAYIYTTI